MRKGEKCLILGRGSEDVFEVLCAKKVEKGGEDASLVE